MENSRDVMLNMIAITTLANKMLIEQNDGYSCVLCTFVHFAAVLKMQIRNLK